MHRKYLSLYFFVFLVSTLGTLFVNALVDPLWYFKGNRFSHRNFPFDERGSKTQLFLKTKDQNYDCILFGSSRVTLLRESLFEENNCFNYAFSAGSASEFLQYANYISDQGVTPNKVYIGIDGSNFKPGLTQTDQSVTTLPVYRAYLSFDVLLFSLRILSGRYEGPRYYNSERNFESGVVTTLPDYQPKFRVRRSSVACDPSRIDIYRQIQQEFPEAEVVGFVPPISAWHLVNNLYHYGDLMDCYFSVVHQLAQEFETVYDFSIPSDITQNPANSYNGGHYYPDTQEKVAYIIQGRSEEFGVDVSQYSETEYRRLYLSSVEQFLTAQERRDLIRDDFQAEAPAAIDLAAQ